MRQKYLHKLIVLAFCVLITTNNTHAAAFNELELNDVQVEYTFGEVVEIQAVYPSDLSLDRIAISIREGTTGITHVAEAEFDTSGLVRYSHELAQFPFRPFQTIYFWFELWFINGERVTSLSYTFFYEDNRFDWNTFESPPVIVHTYDGDSSFGQEVIDATHEGIQKIQELLPLPLPGKLEIYIYTKADDMPNSGIQYSATRYGSHADPSTGIVLVSLPDSPDRNLEMGRIIPNEIAHIMLQTYTGSGYAQLPLWFIEGFSSKAELNHDPEDLILLDSAYDNEILFPIEALCEAFPIDTTSTDNAQANAQSASFVSFLLSEYSMSGLQVLLDLYSDGISCIRGTQEAFGIPLNQLDRRWKQEQFTEAGTLIPANSFIPWIILLTIILFIPLWIIVNRFYNLFSRSSGS